MTLLLAAGLFALAIAFAGLAYAGLSTPGFALVIEGRRGAARALALRSAGWFRAADPPMRKLAGWFSRAPFLARARATLGNQLASAGYPLGLSTDEWLALCLLSALCGLAAGTLTGEILEGGSTPPMAGTLVGLALPYLRLRAARDRRYREIAHGLPGAMDLAGLCMGAGLDFSASLEIIVEQASRSNNPLVIELQHILRALHLGRTRSAALDDFARAAPIPCVQELVASIQQAERKGTPLGRVLAVQAEILRRKRGVAAEEAASRAGVMLVLPLLLLMGCVLLLLFSRFIINGFGL